MKILVVDDEPLICSEFRDILQDEGFDVDTAANGKEAIHKINGASYELVFLDVLMPKMEGREVFEAIKKISKVPVAIMSGYMPPNKEQEVLKAGAVACLRKPLVLDEVRTLINSIESRKK